MNENQDIQGEEINNEQHIEDMIREFEELFFLEKNDNEEFLDEDAQETDWSFKNGQYW